ncbi:MAG: hypothetical protein IPK03_05250 [Bacteroidetes bacterium]|nr:hypothetical protein [Bacteroidota bacterium]
MNLTENKFLTSTFPIIVILFLGYCVYGSFIAPKDFAKESLPLSIFKTWSKTGIQSTAGIPAIDTQYQHNLFPKYAPNGIQKNQFKYLISHPPFAYYLGYFFFLLLGENWFLINYLLTFISAFFIYATVCVLCYHRLRDAIHMPALFAFLIYLSNPFVSHNQLFNYHPDILVQTLFIALAYIILKMIMRKRQGSFKYLFFFAILNFIMVYTSWAGVLFSITILVYGIFNLRKGYAFAHITSLAFVTMILAMSLMIMQYSQANGLEAYFHFLTSTYLKETSAWYILYSFKTLNIFNSFAHLFAVYFKAYWAIYLAIFIFILFSITGKKKKIVFTKNGYRYLLLSSLPVVLTHLILMKYSISGFTMLYGLVFMSVMMGILFDKIEKTKIFEPYIFLILSSIIIIAQLIQGLIIK